MPPARVARKLPPLTWDVRSRLGKRGCSHVDVGDRHLHWIDCTADLKFAHSDSPDPQLARLSAS